MFLRKIIFLFVCLTLTSCLVQKDDAGFKQSITSDARVVGNWDVQKWGDEDLSCTGCRDLTIEEQQQEDKAVYQITSSNSIFTEDITDFITLYHFGDADFVYSGFPDACESCALLKYEVAGDTLKVYVLKDQDAVKVLQELHPAKTKIYYEENQTSDAIRIDVLDDESKILLSALAQKNELWTEFIVMKKM